MEENKGVSERNERKVCVSQAEAAAWETQDRSLGPMQSERFI